MSDPDRPGETEPGEAEPVEIVETEPGTEAIVGEDELPVVARMVVEIRSDGSRTIARGVLEDHIQGEKVAVEAKAPTLPGLATGLARALMRMPGIERRAARKLEHDGSARRRGLVGRLRGRLLGDDS